MIQREDNDSHVCLLCWRKESYLPNLKRFEGKCREQQKLALELEKGEILSQTAVSDALDSLIEKGNIPHLPYESSPL